MNWKLYDDPPEGFFMDKHTGSPLTGYDFYTNGKSVLNGGLRILVKAAIKCRDIEDLESHIKVAFKNGASWLKSLLLEKLQVYKGAMILDGYDPEDSCIKFMNELIEEINGGEYSSWISVEKQLPKKDCFCFTKGMGLNVLFSQNGKFYSVIEGGYRISMSGITHWMYIPE